MKCKTVCVPQKYIVSVNLCVVYDSCLLLYLFIRHYDTNVYECDSVIHLLYIYWKICVILPLLLSTNLFLTGLSVIYKCDQNLY